MTVEERTAVPEAAALPEKQLLYWCVRREVWENRSLYIAPLVAASVILFGFLVTLHRLPRRARGWAALDPIKAAQSAEAPFAMMAGIVFFTGMIVAAFYCLDALYGERRDRSILFWKSLPVSDRTTVLSKAAVPMVFMPLYVLPIIVVGQLFMFIVSTMVLITRGVNPAELWSRVPLVQMTIALIYALIIAPLWHAPIYGWLLLISAWAKRMPLLWAVFPPMAIAAFEHMVSKKSAFGLMLKHRVIGWFTRGYDPAPGLEPLEAMTIVRFFSTPGLWLGLIFAAVCIAAAVRLRRNREPI